MKHRPKTVKTAPSKFRSTGKGNFQATSVRTLVLWLWTLFYTGFSLDWIQRKRARLVWNLSFLYGFYTCMKCVQQKPPVTETRRSTFVVRAQHLPSGWFRFSKGHQPLVSEIEVMTLRQNVLLHVEKRPRDQRSFQLSSWLLWTKDGTVSHLRNKRWLTVVCNGSTTAESSKEIEMP